MFYCVNNFLVVYRTNRVPTKVGNFIGGPAKMTVTRIVVILYDFEMLTATRVPDLLPDPGYLNTRNTQFQQLMDSEGQTINQN